jgi:hypothetical protein
MSAIYAVVYVVYATLSKGLSWCIAWWFTHSTPLLTMMVAFQMVGFARQVAHSATRALTAS